jgi:TolA-binding protein
MGIDSGLKLNDKIKDLTARVKELEADNEKAWNIVLHGDETVLLAEQSKKIEEYHEANQKRHFRIVELEAQLKEKQIIIVDLCDKWEEAKKEHHQTMIDCEREMDELRKQNTTLHEMLNAVSEEEWDKLKDQNASLKEAALKVLNLAPASIGDFAEALHALSSQLSNQGDEKCGS